MIPLAPQNADTTVLSYRIIKRRIAWLFGKWFAENSSIQSHDKVWQTLLFLLRDQGESSDLVVRLTAATSLKTCVDVSTPEGEGVAL